MAASETIPPIKPLPKLDLTRLLSLTNQLISLHDWMPRPESAFGRDLSLMPIDMEIFDSSRQYDVLKVCPLVLQIGIRVM